MVDAGAPELFVRFAAGGAQMKEDVALRDFLGFILIPDRPVGWGRRGGFGIAAVALSYVPCVFSTVPVCP